MRAALNWLNRPELERVLRSQGFECYPHEKDDELREALAQHLECEGLTLEDVQADADADDQPRPFLL